MPEKEQLKSVREQNSRFVLEYTLDSYSNRIRVEHYRGNVALISERITELAQANGFAKAVIRIRKSHFHQFISLGFIVEAVYQQYFSGDDALSVAKFFDSSRKTSLLWIEEDEQLQQVLNQPLQQIPSVSDVSYNVRLASVADCNQLAQIYRRVFAVYPTPIHDATYIEELMDNGAVFVVAEVGGEITSTASAHIDAKLLHAEIAECVTLPEYRSKGLMKILILHLHEILRSKGIFVSIANARSRSFGMNSTFHQLGYSYGGRLLNHCIIYEGLENLNVWTKDLSCADSRSPLQQA